MVWRDSFVEENDLADNVSRLRKVLRDGENGEKFIETVPKRGYRFIAAVKKLNGETLLPVNKSTGTGLNKYRTALAASFVLVVLILAAIGLYPRVYLETHRSGLLWHFSDMAVLRPLITIRADW